MQSVRSSGFAYHLRIFNEVVSGLSLFATVVIFASLGILISSIQHDVSFFAEQMAAISVISATAYAINATWRHKDAQRIIIGGCFMVATWAYFIPIFSTWAVSIMTDTAIIIFCLIGVTNDGNRKI